MRVQWEAASEIRRTIRWSRKTTVSSRAYPGNTVSHAHIKISLIRAWRTDKGNKVISRIGNRARPTLSHACTFSLGYLPVFLPNGDCIGYERKTKFANNLRARIRMSRRYRSNVCTALVFSAIPSANTESPNFQISVEIWQLDSTQIQEEEQERRMIVIEIETIRALVDVIEI